jgi:hypothetical protein
VSRKPTSTAPPASTSTTKKAMRLRRKDNRPYWEREKISAPWIPIMCVIVFMIIILSNL